jgi:hypothetical protein
VTAFKDLQRYINVAVEGGSAMHITLGSGSILDKYGAASLMALSILSQTTSESLYGDIPPTPTTGDPVVHLLAQSVIRSNLRSVNRLNQYEPHQTLLTGLTPFSYAAGAMLSQHDHQPTITIAAGHFGIEVALIAEAAWRTGSYTLGASDHPSAQAVMFGVMDDALSGEDVFSSGAYMTPSIYQRSSLTVQDLFRLVLVSVLVIGAFGAVFLQAMALP